MKMRILFAAFLLLSFVARAQDDIHLIDPIIEVPSERELMRFSQSEIKDWGWTMMNPTAFHQKGITGEGIIVAIIDTGVDDDHEDLRGKVLRQYSRSWVNEPMKDGNGHGTWCASRVASPENGVGVVGIAPDVVIIDLKVLSASGSGSSANVAAAYRYFADLKLPPPYNNYKRITSASLGGGSTSDLEQAIKYATEKGVVNVCAAGNSYREGQNTIGCPGCYDAYSITVGANDSKKEPAYFSSAGEQLDVCAPGVSLDGAWKDNTYRKASGTSMATPGVAGAIALLWQANPELSGHRVMELFVEKYAQDIHTPGFDKRTGHGLVYLPNYTNADPGDPSDDPDEPDDPGDDPDQPDEPDGEFRTTRTMTVPVIDPGFPVLWKSGGADKFEWLYISGMEVRYTGRLLADDLFVKINQGAKEYFTNRGYVTLLGDDFHEGAFWIRYFYEMMIPKEQGLDVKISYLEVRNDKGQITRLGLNDRRNGFLGKVFNSPTKKARQNGLKSFTVTP